MAIRLVFPRLGVSLLVWPYSVSTSPLRVGMEDEYLFMLMLTHGAVKIDSTREGQSPSIAAEGNEAKRASDAMMDMKKIDVAAIEAARRG
jgi:hypothetical protein